MKRIVIDAGLRDFVSHEEGLVGRVDADLVWAASAQEVVEAHRKEPAILIVTGLDPAGMPAERLCSAIREGEATRGVSIVVVGSGSGDERERLRACRANHYFEQPVDHAEFTSTVRQLVSVAARQKYGVLVSVEVEGSVKGMPFFAKTENLSVSGILLATARTLKVGDVADLAFFLPGYGRLLVEAEVVRVEPRGGAETGYGARFVNISPSVRAAIGAFVGSRFGGRRPEGPRG